MDQCPNHSGNSRHFAPFLNRHTTPSKCARRFSGYGPYSPTGRNGERTPTRHPKVEVETSHPSTPQAPTLPSRSPRDHNSTQAQTRREPCRRSAHTSGAGRGGACRSGTSIQRRQLAPGRRVLRCLIVGWRVATHMRTYLPLGALKMALWRQKIKKAADLVHHSDAGAQYVFIRCAERLAEVGASASVPTAAPRIRRGPLGCARRATSEQPQAVDDDQQGALRAHSVAASSAGSASSSPGRHELEHPAPSTEADRRRVRRRRDHAHREIDLCAGRPRRRPPTATRGLGIAGLVVGLLGLIAGGPALARGRRSTS